MINETFGTTYSQKSIIGRAGRMGLHYRTPRTIEKKYNSKVVKEDLQSLNSNVVFADLKPNDCRYMNGSSACSTVCAKPIARGSYCEEHYILTHDGDGGKIGVRRDMNEGIKV